MDSEQDCQGASVCSSYICIRNKTEFMQQVKHSTGEQQNLGGYSSVGELGHPEPNSRICNENARFTSNPRLVPRQTVSNDPPSAAQLTDQRRHPHRFHRFSGSMRSLWFFSCVGWCGASPTRRPTSLETATPRPARTIAITAVAAEGTPEGKMEKTGKI